MKIFCWNCYFGFNRKKYKQVMELDKFDIYIILESRKSELDIFNHKTADEYETIWFSDHTESPNNQRTDYGIGIAVKKTKFEIKETEYSDIMKKHRYVYPLRIIDNSNNKSFILCLVWTKERDQNQKKYENYHVPLYNAFNECNNILDEKDVILIGDFNTGSVKGNQRNDFWYTKLKTFLYDLNFENCANEKDEWELTFFGTKGHVIDDHCFIKGENEINVKNCNLTLGKKEIWINDELSDHIPLFVSIDY